MKKNLIEFCQELEKDITGAYEAGVTLEQSERLAAKFLLAQMRIGEELQGADLNTRMRKSGLKAVKAAVYLESATKTERKPSDVMLEAIVNSDKLVNDEQTGFDESEASRNALDNYLSVFREAHIFFRGIAKGRFE